MKRWTIFEVVVVLAMVTVMATLVTLVVRDYRAQRLCEERGGTVERYNWRWVCDGEMSCSQVSDWRCVGLPAETP